MMRTANNGNNEWAKACIVDGGGSVDTASMQLR
jgi:hypothetical protein